MVRLRNHVHISRMERAIHGNQKACYVAEKDFSRVDIAVGFVANFLIDEVNLGVKLQISNKICPDYGNGVIKWLPISPIFKLIYLFFQ